MNMNAQGSDDVTDSFNPARVYRNLPVPRLIEHSLACDEGILTPGGALVVYTGKYTGRSPDDKFIVDTPTVHDEIWWGSVNRAFSRGAFERLYVRMSAYLQNRELFVFDGFAGADPAYRLPIRFVNEFAWQNLFVHQLFIRPTAEELAVHQPGFTVVCAPGFRASPEVDGTHSEAFVVINFEKRLVLIGGTHYAGEMKKSVFTVLNYLLPWRQVLPMHCSANMGAGGDTALFFGLSGTGKTTLSADPGRRLIGDDEHGWSDSGVFNFEGGCYAKCIRLSRENEPQIWQAIRFGTVLENVVVDSATRVVDYNSDQFTENTRAAYPVDMIPDVVIPGQGGHPGTVVFLTADAFGVLPPVARMTREQAMYHFLSGYTSKLAGTERGVKEPEATFSTCFGAPFLPLEPMAYAEMLGERIARHNTAVYLINTGWSGGPYGVGQRINLPYTRAMVSAVTSGQLDRAACHPDPVFNLMIPDACPGVPSEVLQPRNTWADRDDYDRKANELSALFSGNFGRFSRAPREVAAAGPQGR